MTDACALWVRGTPLQLRWSDEDGLYLATSLRPDFDVTAHGETPVEALGELLDLLKFLWEEEVRGA
jgi:predicted RNase H-like HicB family nuclease